MNPVVVMTVMAWRNRRAHNGEGDFKPKLAIPLVVGFCAWVVVFSWAVARGSVIVAGFWNPEYWAIREVMGAVR